MIMATMITPTRQAPIEATTTWVSMWLPGVVARSMAEAKKGEMKAFLTILTTNQSVNLPFQKKKLYSVPQVQFSSHGLRTGKHFQSCFSFQFSLWISAFNIQILCKKHSNFCLNQERRNYEFGFLQLPLYHWINAKRKSFHNINFLNMKAAKKYLCIPLHQTFDHLCC